MEYPKGYGVNMNGFVNAGTSAMQFYDFSSQAEAFNKEVEKQARYRNKLDEENHDNLESIAQFTGETVEHLKESNEALKENNNLLKEKNESLKAELSKISEILHEIFDVEQDGVEENRELMQQARELACNIDASLKKGERISWKDKAVDVGIQALFQAVGILLKMNGI